MAIAAVSEVKARLSEFLGRVKAGEEVIVTEHGKPVARLCPLARSAPAEDRMANLEKRGLIRLGTGALPRKLWRMRRPDDPAGLVLSALLEERDGGR